MELEQVRSNSAKSSWSASVYTTVAVLAVTILGYSPPTWSAALAESAVIQLEYKEGMQRIAPTFKNNYGKYLGSGTGNIKGVINGMVVWDLFEEQSDPQLHRTQFVGRITSSDGGTVSFESTGYFIPRPGDEHYWDLTSAIYFTDAKGVAYQELAHRIGLWQGNVHILTDADAHTTFSHTYTLYLTTTKSLP
ncbi:MAG TPA: hypothetical protein VE029_06490 [Rhizobacter sp.]|nr:hypothetical protein [Rhizobacter sp.]